jgi:hypothetical protein
MWNVTNKKLHRTLVFGLSLVYRTIRSSNQLPAGLLASFSWILNAFRKRVKSVVTGKRIVVGIVCEYVVWTDVIYVKLFYFVVKWATVNLGDNCAKYTYVRVTCTEGTWLYCDCFIWCVSFTVFVLTGCVMCVCVCVCVCVCGCFVNICTCVYCVFVCTVSFIYSLSYFFLLYWFNLLAPEFGI